MAHCEYSDNGLEIVYFKMQCNQLGELHLRSSIFAVEALRCI
jgi:hypothetical protein